MAHRIQTVKNGTKQEAWQIDAISGSTVTSKAIGRALDESTQKMVPFVHRYLTELERAGQ
jgi:electron transport complex protein RnfG